MKTALLLGFLALWQSGCVFGLFACEDFAAPGIRITISDAVTGETVVGEIVAIATSGTFADTLRGVSDGTVAGTPMSLASERVGTYSVSVAVEGYELWQRDDVVVVEEDNCHVRTNELIARVRPLP